jgi:hypothetical protein
MKQKHLLRLALDFVGAQFDAKGAARAWCVIAWLSDMNWHPEAAAIEARARGTFGNSFVTFTAKFAESELIGGIIRFLNRICGHGFKTSEWQATEGEALVNELWEIINKPAQLANEQSLP